MIIQSIPFLTIEQINDISYSSHGELEGDASRYFYKIVDTMFSKMQFTSNSYLACYINKLNVCNIFHSVELLDCIKHPLIYSSSNVHCEMRTLKEIAFIGTNHILNSAEVIASYIEEEHAPLLQITSSTITSEHDDL